MTGSALWQAIAETLRTEIRSGAYAPGDRLPSEADLARRFGVNRHTVRHALSVLVAASEVRTRKGAGVFVAAKPTDYALGARVRFNQNLLASGRTPSRQFLRMETRDATGAEAEVLALDKGARVHVVEGISAADGEPVGLFLSVFPAQPLAHLLDHLRASGSVTKALRMCGVADYTRVTTRLSAEAADSVVAGHLRLAQGAPVLRSVAVNLDPAGLPVEYGTTIFAGDRVTLTVSAAG